MVKGIADVLSGKGLGNEMRRGPDRQAIGYSVIAGVIFWAVFLLTFHGRAEQADQQTVKIVTFGDSVLGEIRDETAVPAQLEELLGESVYNAALGGTCMARQRTDGRLDYTRDCLSLAGLAKAIWADDFGVQRAARIRESNTEYFGEVLEGLEKVDFSQVEIVLIQQGLNDFHAGTPIENSDAPYDEYTFLGALRTAVRALRKVNPTIRIVVVTPTYTWYKEKGLTCEEMDQGGGTMEAYVEAELRAAQELGIEVIDVYHDFFPHESWDDWSIYSRDGLHPNEAGREKLALRIAEVLKEGI